MTNVSDIGEFGLIRRLGQGLAERNPRIVLGLGDDTAAMRLESDLLLLATCDIQIEGVHFLRGPFSGEHIGRRAAAVNLSDIAAMGGTPSFALISLAIPGDTDIALVDDIYRGLQAVFSSFQTSIVGGNTARLPERLAVDVTLLGQVAEGEMLRRSGARPGDVLCVTGSLGAAAAGLATLQQPGLHLPPDLEEAALAAHRTPRPRVAEGRCLAKSAAVTACIDVSDGLVGDAAHIAEESGVAIRIDADRIPIARCAAAAADALGRDPAAFAAGGGEDFELLFAVRPSELERLTGLLGSAACAPLTAIGEVRAGAPEVVVERGGRRIAAAGFEHFRA